MRKPAFCICADKGTDKLRGNPAADWHLCFPYTDSTILLLPKSKILNLLPSSVAAQPGLSYLKGRFSHDVAQIRFILMTEKDHMSSIV